MLHLHPRDVAADFPDLSRSPPASATEVDAVNLLLTPLRRWPGPWVVSGKWKAELTTHIRSEPTKRGNVLVLCGSPIASRADVVRPERSPDLTQLFWPHPARRMDTLASVARATGIFSGAKPGAPAPADQPPASQPAPPPPHTPDKASTARGRLSSGSADQPEPDAGAGVRVTDGRDVPLTAGDEGTGQLAYKPASADTIFRGGLNPASMMMTPKPPETDLQASIGGLLSKGYTDRHVAELVNKALATQTGLPLAGLALGPPTPAALPASPLQKLDAHNNPVSEQGEANAFYAFLESPTNIGVAPLYLASASNGTPPLILPAGFFQGAITSVKEARQAARRSCGVLASSLGSAQFSKQVSLYVKLSPAAQAEMREAGQHQDR